MSPDRPINADVPASDEPKAAPPAAEKAVEKADPKPGTAKAKAPAPPKAPKPKRERRPIPGALKGIAALVLVAIVFIVAAVLGGSGGGKDDSEPAAPAPTPAVTSDEEPPEGGSSASAEELGYPAFATGNTTRVGGPDPVSNAAGVALAVFPSTTPAQRPAAVTLVDEDDPAGAIAAAVLMAEPLRAPLLISGQDLPEPSAEAFAALDPQGSKKTGGANAFAIGPVATPDGATVAAVKVGTTPAATAAAIAAQRDRLFGSPPAHIVVAPGDDLALALPAAAWAARSGDPVLFTEGAKLPAATVAALKRHPKVPVYVLGPSSAISSETLRAIAKVGGEVRRVSGEDPVANAIAFARYADGNFGWNVNDPGHGFVLARSDAPLNAAAAAPLSASGTWGPLLLSDSATSLPASLREYFLDVKPGYTTNPTRAFYNHVWVIGDQEAIDVNQQAEVNELAELAKIGGAE
ncbi:MAG TPA: cell wall-binding repeat-containing protein [Solirubrobacterales bacterium]|nr:cell wall-binding repeat-containing protein [Solirubrobacterales bacterium]